MRLILSTNPNRKSGCVLGYFQSSLRDWYRHILMAGLFPVSTSVADPQKDEAGLLGDISQQRSRVPHVSRFFREMWEMSCSFPETLD
jgi:hypothetical protein